MWGTYLRRGAPRKRRCALKFASSDAHRLVVPASILALDSFSPVKIGDLAHGIRLRTHGPHHSLSVRSPLSNVLSSLPPPPQMPTSHDLRIQDQYLEVQPYQGFKRKFRPVQRFKIKNEPFVWHSNISFRHFTPVTGTGSTRFPQLDYIN